MRTFHLHRKVDQSGVSGIGIVAQGVVFDDGVVALRWLSGARSTAIYDSIRAVDAIHGHNGSSVIVFDDGQPTPRLDRSRELAARRADVAAAARSEAAKRAWATRRARAAQTRWA